jgi:hypothetical protein
MSLDLTADLYEVCQQISPRHPGYATLSIEDGFDWSSLSCCLFERLYLVAFRSLRRPDVDLDLLSEHDDRAYEEALESGGLLRYFKGHANERGECLSFSGRRASRPDRPLTPPRTAQPSVPPRRCTSHTRSNVTGYRRPERSWSSSRYGPEIRTYDRGGKRHAPPV